MKESLWGYWLIILGIFILSVMLLLQNYTTTNEQDVYLIKEITDAAMGDSLDLAHYRKYGEIRIIKEKFVFGIYEDEECNNLIKEVKSNKNDGYVIFEELRYGKYYIKELKAPAGYELSNKVVSIEINDNGVFADGNLIEENDSIYNINFENDIIEVPNTGDDRHTEIFALIGGLSAISLAGAVAYNNKKKNNKKKK